MKHDLERIWALKNRQLNQLLLDLTAKASTLTYAQVESIKVACCFTIDC